MEKKKSQRKRLIEIYEENDSLDYDFNYDEENIISENNLLICGILEKIKTVLLALDTEEEKEENVGEGIDRYEDEDAEGEEEDEGNYDEE